MKSSGEPGGRALVLGCGASQRQRSSPLHLDQGGQSCWSRSSLGCESPSAALEPPEHTDVFQQPRILGARPALPRGQYLQSLNATLTAFIKFLSKGRLELQRARQALRTERHSDRHQASCCILSGKCPLPKPAAGQTLCPLSENQATGKWVQRG